MTAYIILSGQIDSENAGGVMAGILEKREQKEDLNIVIFSPGGDIAAGFGLYDLLRSYPQHITTEVWGECCSIAVAVLMAGDIRRISPCGRIMIHNGRSVASEGFEATGEDFVRHSKEIKCLDDLYHKLLGDRTGQPMSKI